MKRTTTSARRKRLSVVAAGTVLLGLVAALLFGAQQAGAAGAVTVKPTADAYVRSDQPDANFGAKYVLDAQAGSATSPTQVSYIQFVVNGLTATPGSVQLQVYSYATSATGLQVWSAANTWSETAISYNTAPPLSQTMVGAIPTISTNAWATLDVSNVVTGNGTYTFAITTTSTANKQLASRESSASSPALIIQTSTPPTISASSGSGQAAEVGTAFAQPLAATVRDGAGAGVPNAEVTFSAPTSGPSGAFAGGASAVSVMTDASGVATAPTFTANDQAGSYSVTATTTGVTSPATFTLSNGAATSPPTTSPASTTSSSPSDSTSTSPPSTTSATTSGAPQTTTSFSLTADSYVRSDQPDTNFGAKYNLAAEAGSASTPTITSYVTVSIQGLSGTINSATLQLYSYSTSPLGINVWSTANGWSETGITYNNAPALGAAAGSAGSIALNTWASVDLSSAITGNGTYSFAITTARTANNTFGSRESGTPPKVVVITSVGTSTPPPTSTSATSTTTTPTSTPTTSTTAASSSATSTSASTTTTLSGGVNITATGGAGQSATVGTAFAAPLSAEVVDGSGQPIANESVTFTTPATGPTATFSGGSHTITLPTDAQGTVSSPQVTAGSAAGSYAVTASTSGAAQAASFSLTNTDPTIVAAGDIACDAGSAPTATSCQQVATSDLAMSLHPDAVLPLGDDQYELGSLSDYQSMYDPSWGRLNSIAYPVPGNHEYGYIGSSIQPTGGTGYFTYFGDRSHPQQLGCTTLCTSYYSYNIGSWHLIALDSQCAVIGGCNPGNPEYKWLQADLKANNAKCTLAYWHIPIYSSSQDHQPDMQAIYSLLYMKGADVVLSGHAHFYERFGPQDGAGNADPVNGVPEFIVGSGGRSFFPIRATPSPNSQARIANTFGVLQMTLSDGGYSWKFVAANGGSATDSGSAACH